MTGVALAPRDVQELQVAINHEHAQVENCARDMVAHAVKCGELLLEAKAILPHGSWATWREANITVGEWMAQKYMAFAREERANPGRLTGMPSIRAALKAIAAPPRPEVDPASSTGQMLSAAKAIARGDDEDDIVDAHAVEIAPSGVEERRWNTALKRMDEVRRCMSEAVNPDLNPEAAARALQEASVAARQTAVDLEQMAAATRRRT